MRKIGPNPFRLVGLSLVILLSVLGLTACGDSTAAPVASTGSATSSSTNPTTTTQGINPATKAAVGAMAPDFNLNSQDGQPVRLSALRGKAVLINYWSVY